MICLLKLFHLSLDDDEIEINFCVIAHKVNIVALKLNYAFLENFQIIASVEVILEKPKKSIAQHINDP